MHFSSYQGQNDKQFKLHVRGKSTRKLNEIQVFICKKLLDRRRAGEGLAEGVCSRVFRSGFQDILGLPFHFHIPSNEINKAQTGTTLVKHLYSLSCHSQKLLKCNVLIQNHYTFISSLMSGEVPSCGLWLTAEDSGGSCSLSPGPSAPRSSVIRSPDALGHAAFRLHETRG